MIFITENDYDEIINHHCDQSLMQKTDSFSGSRNYPAKSAISTEDQSRKLSVAKKLTLSGKHSVIMAAKHTFTPVIKEQQ